MKMIIRVFPRKTRATPDDDMVSFKFPGLLLPEADEVHVSVVFTWDIPRAEKLYYQWSKYYLCKLGGPAFNQSSGDFVPGMYLKKGYVITSRGCPNNCWFCSVPEREGKLRELPITEGWNVLDDNLLACSDSHIRQVFKMLKSQPQKAQFTGGLEAARLKSWHVDLLVDLKPAQMFFAYDTPNDLEPLISTSKMLKDAGFNRQSMRCYVLIGYPNDTINKAEKRLLQTIELGFFPMAMLYRDHENIRDIEWMRFQRMWSRPAIIYHKMGSLIGQKEYENRSWIPA